MMSRAKLTEAELRTLRDGAELRHEDVRAFDARPHTGIQSKTPER